MYLDSRLHIRIIDFRTMTCTMHSLLIIITFLTCLTNAFGKTIPGTCGREYGLTCEGSEFGECCSQWNHCGSSPLHCGTGCQSEFGDCHVPEELGIDPHVSPDGGCGSVTGFTCTGGVFGACCSAYGFCGDSEAHCCRCSMRSFGRGMLTSCSGRLRC